MTNIDQLELLQEENERLRRTVHTLMQAHKLLLDCLGQWTFPTIPNN